MIQDLWLQFGTRLGKTFFSLCALIWSAIYDPAPLMYTTASEGVATRVVKTKLYPMLERIQQTRDQLKPVKLRNAQRVDLRECTIFVGWSGSPTSIADLAAKRGLASEIDKWDTSASTEADPLYLWNQRFNEFFNRKRIKEGTPTVRGRSRVEAGRLSADNRSFWVACPHCHGFQTLRFGPPQPESPGGLVWDHLDNGKSDPLLAWRTARYECQWCRQPIPDELRGQMMRSGIWAAEGQTVESGRVVGSPVRAGPAASFFLPSLYALAGLGWGDIAREWCLTKGNPRAHQNTVNSWLAETWVEVMPATTADDVVSRLVLEYPAGQVHPACRFLTMGVDKQIDHYVYQVWGWGEEACGYLVQYGVADDWETVATLLNHDYPQTDLARTMRIKWCLIDARYQPDDVVAFCRGQHHPQRPVLPCQGVGDMHGEPYRIDTPKRSTVASRRKELRASVNTHYWQSVLQHALTKRRAHEPGAMAFCREVGGDADYLAQMLGEAPEEVRSIAGQTSVRWREVSPGSPVDLRDAARYARCAAEMVVDRRWHLLKTLSVRVPGEGPAAAAAPQTPPSAAKKPKAAPPAQSALKIPSWLTRHAGVPRRRR